MNQLFNPLFKSAKSGKEHSLRYDESHPEFAKWLRLKYYNVEMFNIDVYDLKKQFENN